MADFWVESLDISGADVILDIGCARGNVPYWWRNQGLHGYGCDISEWCIENGHLPKGIIKQADIRLGIPWGDNMFSKITCRDVLEHIPESDIDTVILEIERILQPKGLVALVPRTNRAGKEDRKRNSINNDPSHVLIRTPFWWVNRVRSVSNLSWCPMLTLESSSKELAMMNDWDILVFTIPA